MTVFIFLFSVLLRYATVSELESPDTPYIKRILRVSMKKEFEFEFEFLVFNATFSNISAISWRPVIVMEEDFTRIFP